MEQVTIGLVKKNIKIKNYYNDRIHVLISIIVSVFTVLLIWLEVNIVISLLFLFSSNYLLRKYIRIILPDWLKENDFRGKMILLEDSIEIRDKQNLNIRISEIKEIQIHSNYYQGFQQYRNYVQNGLGSLTIISNDDSILTFKFCILKKNQFIVFSEILKLWHMNGLKIKETNSNQKYRAFFLKSYLSEYDKEILKNREED